MGRLLVLFALVDLVVLATALIDCLSVPAEEIRALPRVVWALIIVFFTPIGGVAWFLAGRPVAVPAGAVHGHPGGAGAPVSRPPDDDPEFLRALGGSAAPASPEDVDLLRRWEADLRRREDELRRRDRRDPPDPEPPGR